MARVEGKYQKCVKDITTEKGWKSENHGNQPLAAVIHFHFPIHTYSATYTEMKDVMKLLVLLDGKERVERELGVKIK